MQDDNAKLKKTNWALLKEKIDGLKNVLVADLR
jgi:hypothetical protein